MINKDTKIYGSFSTTPGNNGCDYFNNLFQSKNINAIYKSFYSDDIEKSIEAAITLNFSGFAVSMPFKTKVLKYVNEKDDAVCEIGAANTIINNNGNLKAYNTDWVGVYNYLKGIHFKEPLLTILGNGGFSKSTQYACNKLNISTNIIERNQWSLVPQLGGIIFNCTPVEVYTKGTLIDGRPSTPDGKKIASLQAKEQFKIYTNEP
jgi:shikimate 5-dehydrogenase